jgi:hypothetical protein
VNQIQSVKEERHVERDRQKENGRDGDYQKGEKGEYCRVDTDLKMYLNTVKTKRQENVFRKYNFNNKKKMLS